MRMASFLVRENASESRVNSEAKVTPGALSSVAVRRGPIGDIATTGRGATLVTHPGDDSVTLLNPRTLAVEAIMAVPGEPFAVAVTADRAYVSTSSWSHKDEVAVIDPATRTVLRTYPLAFSITALAVSPDGKRVYAGRTGDGHIDVAVIDVTAERVGTIDVATGAGIGIDALEVDSTGERLYIATTDARGSGLVVVDIETARVERAVPIGPPVRDIAIADGTAYVLTSDRVSGGVLNVIDLATGRIAGLVEIGGAPTQLAMGADKTRAYIVDYDRIVVVCAMTLDVVDTIDMDVQPSSVAVDFHGGRLYVADYDGGVTVFSIDTTVPLLYSHFIATDPIVVPEVHEPEPATV
ncbi:YncE family protein [Mycobacterium sp. IDR2000157661]|uniref:YncE family protein n=1 Tax=Mycobacterium sp. IDR2000157661 TaxID=2867005 RepID=UPI001EEC4E1D|nr:YncE family protein [Mycobacterium sp. IDR2000157661]ULE31345.1 YncE family protein [Mycobacterium sp. IDR2000157661]